MIPVERKSDIAYKSLKGVASTSTLRAYYEETHPFAPRVFPSQVWLQADLIPVTAPGGTHDEITGVVQRKIDVVLTQEPGKPNAWYSTELQDAIDPERFGATYLFILKDSLGVTIPPGSGDYEVNPDAGVVTFADGNVQDNAPISISFYKYVGTKGVGSSGPGGVTVMWVDDAVALRSLTTHSDEDTMMVFSTYRVYKYVAGSSLPDDGVAVIKPDDVSGEGRWIAWKVLPSTSDEMELGAAPAGKDWSDGLIPVNDVSMQNEFNYEVSRIMKLIAPVPPTTIAGETLTMTTYSAKQSDTGLDHDCTDDTTPTATLSGIFDPESGDLYVEIDTVDSGRRTLTSGDDSGVYDDLTIVANYDPYAGQAGKEGFYMALDMSVTNSTPFSLGLHSYKFLHTADGESALKSFWVDDPGVTTISAVTITRPASTTRYISGVPSMSVGGVIGFDFTVNNAVKKHYNPTRLAALTGAQVTGMTSVPPVTPPSEGSSPAYTGQNVTVNNASYSENIAVAITPYNSKNVAGTVSNQNTLCRVDTVSNEDARLRSGSGQYPTTGYTVDFDSAVSLKSAGYTEELQLLNGLYQVPTGDYSAVLPTAGPNYTAGIGTGWRYVVPIASFAVASASGFTITFQNGSNLIAGDLDTDNIRVQVKVEGVTGWLDANKSFALVGAPINDGDACMVYSESNGTIRRVSFGNVPKTGQVYIRIGLPALSTKKFSGVVISNIV